MKKFLFVFILFFVYGLVAVSFENFEQLLDILSRKSPFVNIPAPLNLEIEGVKYELSNLSQRKAGFGKLREFFGETKREIEALRVTAQADAGEAEELQEELVELTRRNDEEKVALQAELKRVRDEYVQFRQAMGERIAASQAELQNRLTQLRAD